MDHCLDDVLHGEGGLEGLRHRVGRLDVAHAQVVDDEVQPRLGDDVHERREDAGGVGAVAEDAHVVAQRGALLQHARVAAGVRELPQLRLGGLAVVEAEVVAGLEVHGCGAAGVVLQVHGEELDAPGVVVELVEAHGHVHVHREVVLVVVVDALVQLERVLRVAADEVHRGERQLVNLGAVVDEVVSLKEQLVVVGLEGGVEQQPDPELCPLGHRLRALNCLGVLAKEVKAAPPPEGGALGRPIGLRTDANGLAWMIEKRRPQRLSPRRRASRRGMQQARSTRA